MRQLLLAGLVLGLLMAAAAGSALVVWDLSASNKSELWRMETGSTGLLTIWLASMILYIDFVWQQRSTQAFHPGSQLNGDALLGWILVVSSIVLAATGIQAYQSGDSVAASRSIPISVIRLGMSGLVLAFGVCILRQSQRRSQAEQPAPGERVEGVALTPRPPRAATGEPRRRSKSGRPRQPR